MTESWKQTLPIVDVLTTLTWAEGTADLALWRATYESVLEARLHTRLATNDDYACIVQALDLLPPATRQRFLRAPAVSSLLLQGDERGDIEAGLLATLVMAELAARGSIGNGAEPTWTARGGRVGGLMLPPGSLESAGPERLLAGTEIVLDVASPFVFPDDEFGIEHTVIYGPTELRAVEERLLAAVEILRALPAALPFAETFIEVLAMRRELKETVAFYTSSFSGLIGLSRFTNAHVGSVDTALLAEGLLHESTHGMLYLYEEVTGPFVLEPEANRIAVTSPWTGATIRLQSLVHACAVWYGTYWFLQRALDCGLVSTDRSFQRMEMARLGFRRRPVTSALAVHAPLLTPSIFEFLGEIEDAMRAV